MEISQNNISEKRVKNRSLKKLLIMMLIAIGIFFALVFIEDYAKKVTANIAASRQEIRTEKTIKLKVEKYNEALVKAYETNKSDLMKDLTTDDELERIRLYMTYNYFEKNRKLNTSLINLSFNNIDLDGEEASVETEENWTYFYSDVETGRKIMPEKKIYYNSKYILKKQDDNWLVDSLSIKKTTTEEG